MALNSFGVLVAISSFLSASSSGSSITLEEVSNSVFNDLGKVLYMSSKFILKKKIQFRDAGYFFKKTYKAYFVIGLEGGASSSSPRLTPFSFPDFKKFSKAVGMGKSATEEICANSAGVLV